MTRDDAVAMPRGMPLGTGPFAGQPSSKLGTGQVLGVCCRNLHRLLVARYRPDYQCFLLLPARDMYDEVLMIHKKRTKLLLSQWVQWVLWDVELEMQAYSSSST